MTNIRIVLHYKYRRTPMKNIIVKVVFLLPDWGVCNLSM